MLGLGIIFSTYRIALSIKRPVNSPRLSKITSPPSTNRYFEIFVLDKAALFIRYACPSILLSTTGLSGKCLLRILLVGKDLLDQSF